MTAVYRDPDTGQAIATHSMLKTFRRCPKQAEFKYIYRLKPVRLSKPLSRGKWIHKLLEVHYKGGDWRAEHQRLSAQFNKLFDEEKDFYGDLPREIYQIMVSYFWHYEEDPWKILDVEFVLECEFPDGTLFRCKLDLLVETQFGLYIVDHKSHANLPSLDYRILDAQSADYVWCALRNKIPVQGHIWNYLRTKAPTIPQLAYQGKPNERLSKRAIDTDYPTAVKALRDYGFLEKLTSDNKRWLRNLKSQQYHPGEPQTSPFFRRDILEKQPAMLRRVASEAYHTARRMNAYPWDKKDHIERVVDRSCTFMCSYTDICATQLWGGNIDPILRRNYSVGDPMDYYWDDDGAEERKGDG